MAGGPLHIAALSRLATILGGLPILGVLRGTPAEEAGLQYGDVLVRVNGHPVGTMEAFLEARSLREDAMLIVYFRDGDYVEVELERRRVGAPGLLEVAADVVARRLFGGTDFFAGGTGEEPS